jgi:WD40 repeat protein
LAWKLFSVVIATVLLAILALRLFPDLSPKPLRLVRTWKAHKSPITSLAFFPDGQRLLSASWDGTVRIWKVNDGTKMDELSPSRPIRFATLSPDGQLLAISTYDPHHSTLAALRQHLASDFERAQRLGSRSCLFA